MSKTNGTTRTTSFVLFLVRAKESSIYNFQILKMLHIEMILKTWVRNRGKGVENVSMVANPIRKLNRKSCLLFKTSKSLYNGDNSLLWYILKSYNFIS